MDFRETLNNALNQLLKHEDHLAASLFERAIELGAPKCLVDLKAMTINYRVLPLSINMHELTRYGYYDGAGAENYFKNIINLRNLAQKNSSFQSDYTEALKSLINIKELFFRVAGIDYYTEILKSRTGFFVEEVFALFNTIQKIFDNVVLKDSLNIRYYIPNTNMQEFALDLLEVKAFCLNLLLSYTTVEHTSFQNRGYTATTYADAPFAETTIRENISMYTSASICPRLHLIKGQKARYPEYKAIYDETIAKINKYRKFDCPKILRKEISNKIEHKVNKKTGKDYYAVIKKYERRIKANDLTRSPLGIYLPEFDLFSKLTPFKSNQVCTFELDEIFTRKVFKGVCNMIANGRHWDIKSVRCTFLALSLFGIGLVIYAGLAIAMKFEKYPTVYVEKHC